MTQSLQDRFLQVEDISTCTHEQALVAPRSHEVLSELLILLKGEGTFFTVDGVVRLQAPCIVSIPPRIAHHFKFDTPCAGAMLTFSSSLVRELGRGDRVFDGLLCEAFVAPVHSDTRRVRYLAAALHSIADEIAAQRTGYRSVLEICLSGLLLVTVRAYEEEVGRLNAIGGRDAELVAVFRKLIDDDVNSKRPLAVYATLLRVTPARLRKACVHVTKLPPLQFLHECLLRKSKRLLLYSTSTVAEVSYAVGFDDPAYFSRLFTRRYGICPSRYREQNPAHDPAPPERPAAA